MKRCNFPHRRDARRKGAIERMQTLVDSLKGMKGRGGRERRATLRQVIKNTKRNLTGGKS